MLIVRRTRAPCWPTLAAPSCGSQCRCGASRAMSSWCATGGIETEEELDAALAGVRDECARLIGAGKKVIVQ